LVGNSTAAVASTAAIPQTNPWVALSAMSGAVPGAALCGAAVVGTAQPTPGCVLPQGAIVPPPPPLAAGPLVPTAGSAWPLIAGLLAVVLADILILSRHHHYVPTPVPNSPA
jgi:hypothetical protein